MIPQMKRVGQVKMDSAACLANAEQLESNYNET